MNIKKLLSILIVMVLGVAMSGSVSALGYSQYSHTFTKYSVTNTTLSKFTYVELNDIAPGLRQYLNDTTAENTGCRIVIDVQYKSGFISDPFYTSLIDPQAIIVANSDCVDYLSQIVPCNGSQLVFDWDTVLSKANWNQRLGYVHRIDLGFNTDVTITGIHIIVPDQSATLITEDLSAGAPCTEVVKPL